jgi:thioesterase domain-containing protein/acyl carrier protein
VSSLWLTASLFNAVIDEVPAALRGLRQLLIGGEALSVSHVRRALSLLPWTEIVNGYGPTESATFTCCYRIPRQLDETLNSIPIGHPIGNTVVYILDSHLHLMPIGVPGELYIGGDGLARGYLNRPELTAEKFIACPFGPDPSARMYKTGDIARCLPDGNIEFLGRVDHQVKIRGYRIELGEIEATLTQYPSTLCAVVLARADTPGEKQLVAYIIPKPEQLPTATELKNFLRAKLPPYMIPSAFVFLNELPLTANGKVNRHALPVPDTIRPESANSFVAPRDYVECQLSEIYANLLGVQNISVKDNFFDLGGHSLLVLRVMNQIENILGKTLPIAALFQAPTVEQLADLLRSKGQLSSRSSLVPIQTNGSKLPFFWVHGEASDAFLPRYLGPDQPIYGLRHQSENGYPALYTTVENIAAHYLDELRTVQANGPYHLGGFCFGGLVAFEMAQQLKKQRQEVALLVLLEPSIPWDCEGSARPSAHTPNSPDNGSTIANDVQRHLRNLAALRWKDKFTYVLQRSKGKINEAAVKILSPVKRMVWGIIWTLYPRFGYRIPHSLRSPYILKVYRKAMKNYVLTVYAGRITVFARKENFWILQRWKTLALGGLDIHEVTGHHEDVLKEPHVKAWAEKLKTFLKKSTNRRVPNND